jgi:hypothetical protein
MNPPGGTDKEWRPSRSINPCGSQLKTYVSVDGRCGRRRGHTEVMQHNCKDQCKRQDETSRCRSKCFSPRSRRHSHSRGRSFQHPCDGNRECHQTSYENLPQGEIDVIVCAPLNLILPGREDAQRELRRVNHDGNHNCFGDAHRKYECRRASEKALQINHRPDYPARINTRQETRRSTAVGANPQRQRHACECAACPVCCISREGRE